MKNTSQVDDYVGPVGHEKKFHQTHFGVVRTLKKSKKPSKYVWVKNGVGKFIRVKREEQENNDE
jgi:hypothetical protein